MHRCTIAQKRADGDHARQLPPDVLERSRRFAQFVRQLRQSNAVAVIGRDKYQRFGLLQAEESSAMETGDNSGDDHWEAQDFAATCFVGRVDQVKEYLLGKPAAASAAAAPPVVVEDNGFWKPPGAAGAEDETQPQEEGNAGFWQPPSAAAGENDNADGTFDYFAGNDSANNAAAAEDDPWNTNNNLTEEPQKEEEFHADAGAAAADRFYSGLTRTLETRADSRLYHMRAFNGWVKATQISELDPRTSIATAGKKRSHPSSTKVGAPLRVLDLACGKGGDLGKWVLHSRGIGNYVGIDVARGSLVDAAIRVRKMRQKLKRCTFTCADLGCDVPGRLKKSKRSSQQLQKLSSWSLHQESESWTGQPNFIMVRGGGIALEDKFDVVSIQFAIHYMMQTRKRARRFFQTVSELLEIGGNLVATTIDARVIIEHLMNMGLDLHFDGDETPAAGLEEDAVVSVGGGACQIRFKPEIVRKIFSKSPGSSGDGNDDNLYGLEYTFTLVEGSDHASGVGDAVNLPEWLIPIPVLKTLGEEAGLELEYAQNFHEFFSKRKDPSAHSAAHSALYNMKVLNRDGSISKDEFEISRLYCALKFRKVRESTMQFDDDEDDEMDEDDEPEEIDPAIKAKFLPMALMKAKKASGSDAWASLSSEEKNRLTEMELRKMAI